MGYRDEPMRLTKYEEMLYPQCGDSFTCISPSTWEWLQKEAAQRLKDEAGAHTVREHWQSIVDGNVPFGYRVAER